MSPSKSSMPQRAFRSARAFRTWLTREHGRSAGLLLRIQKRDAGIASITYAEARRMVALGAAKRGRGAMRRLATMCQVLKVERSGFYAWLEQPRSTRGRTLHVRNCIHTRSCTVIRL